MPKAVIDTTVLVSAFLRLNVGGVSAELLHFAERGSFALFLSLQILDELKRVLLTKRHLRARYQYDDAAALEITLTGPEIEFEDGRIVAVCGAQFDLLLGQRRPESSVFLVPPGERLKFGARRRGARAYLAVAGGVAVPPLLGSRSTHLSSRMGGHQGRALVAGDRIPLGEWSKDTSHVRRAAERLDVALPSGDARLRILPGAQADRFRPHALTELESARFQISRDSNRMGYRLEGSVLDVPNDRDPLSTPTVLGALQVPPAGQPILLMADRQTTGGYRTLATVISADIGLAGQLAPGDTVSFQVCSRREALGALIAQERALMSAGLGSRL